MRAGPVLLAAALLLAGCGGHRRHVAAGPPLPSLASVCGVQPAGFRPRIGWLETSDGVRLYTAAVGSGDRVVVFAHESGGRGLCGWLPTMRFLAAHGIRSFAFNFRGHYPSPIPPAKVEYDWGKDLQAAIDAADGKHTALVGASFGGAAVVAYAADLKDVDAVVSVSGELQLPSTHLDAIGNVGRLRLPLLVLASRRDGYLDTTDARQLVRRAGSSDKTLELYPGTLHGWDILDARPAARRLLLAWLTQRLR